jgi:hypothetical protein
MLLFNQGQTVLLDRITPLERERHRIWLGLAEADSYGANGHGRRLRWLEEVLDRLWHRRRQRLAAAQAALLEADSEPYRAREIEELFHVSPVC